MYFHYLTFSHIWCIVRTDVQNVLIQTWVVTCDFLAFYLCEIKINLNSTRTACEWNLYAEMWRNIKCWHWFKLTHPVRNLCTPFPKFCLILLLTGILFAKPQVYSTVPKKCTPCLYHVSYGLVPVDFIRTIHLPLLTKRADVLLQDIAKTRIRKIRLYDFPNRFKIWQAHQQECCRYACQISGRYVKT